MCQKTEISNRYSCFHFQILWEKLQSSCNNCKTIEIKSRISRFLCIFIKGFLKTFFYFSRKFLTYSVTFVNNNADNWKTTSNKIYILKPSFTRVLLITVERTEKLMWKSPVFRGSMSATLFERTFSQSRNFTKKLHHYVLLSTLKTNYFQLWGIPSGYRCKNTLYILEKCRKTSLVNTASPLQKCFFFFLLFKDISNNNQ